MQQMTMFGLNQPEEKKVKTQVKSDGLTDHEYLESIGQANIFDFIGVGQESKRTRKLVQGDRVKIRFYVDEIDYIALCHPQLLGEGIVTKCFTNCCMVSIAGELIKIDNEKTTIIKCGGLE